jgi:processive 1,2-diacylglycerol beta-glucosyltransferase/1,2-diacylglycerol 3-beta-galactosyltransferase
LKTGGGHLSGCKSLAQVIHAEFGEDDETVLVDGFSDQMPLHRAFFEAGYLVSSNYLEFAWKLFYHLSGSHAVMSLIKRLVQRKVVDHLESVFRSEGVTKVVVTHSILVSLARDAINRIDPAIPLITVVMDPFTAHPAWYYERDTDLVVFSRQIASAATGRYGFDPARVHQFPFMISPAFDRRYGPEEAELARSRLGLPSGRRVILVAGGGEGLKGADRLVSSFLRSSSRDLLVVVCGRNKVLAGTLRRIVQLYRADNVIVYDFVSFMPELMNVADCVITKGGPGTILECLAVGKPVIVATYIPGQEYGNMRYVVDSGVGWYSKRPSRVIELARRILDDPDFSRQQYANVASLRLRSGTAEIGRFIHNYPEVTP